MADTIKTFLPHTLAFGTRSGVTEKKFFFLHSRLLDRASCRRLAELGCVKCTYRISSYKTRGYYFFTRPSNAGIIRMRVLIEGWYYYQMFINLDKPWSLYYQNRALFACHKLRNQFNNPFLMSYLCINISTYVTH